MVDALVYTRLYREAYKAGCSDTLFAALTAFLERPSITGETLVGVIYEELGRLRHGNSELNRDHGSSEGEGGVPPRNLVAFEFSPRHLEWLSARSAMRGLSRADYLAVLLENVIRLVQDAPLREL